MEMSRLRPRRANNFGNERDVRCGFREVEIGAAMDTSWRGPKRCIRRPSQDVHPRKSTVLVIIKHLHPADSSLGATPTNDLLVG